MSVAGVSVIEHRPDKKIKLGRERAAPFAHEFGETENDVGQVVAPTGGRAS
jgi:hypothetical protein